MGPAAKESLEPLWKWVHGNKDIELRSHAAQTIGRIGKNDTAIGLRFMEMVRSKNRDEQFLGALGIAEVGAAGKESTPELIQALIKARMLDDGQQRHRLAIALLSALGKLGEAADQAVPEMIKFLEDREEAIDIRKCSADALGNIGPKAKSAVDALTKAGKDPELNVTCEAAIRRITR
jgi:HEAT repeat protein